MVYPAWCHETHVAFSHPPLTSMMKTLPETCPVGGDVTGDEANMSAAGEATGATGEWHRQQSPLRKYLDLCKVRPKNT